MALCAWNSPVTGEFPTQRPVMRSFDVFFYLRLNKKLSKQSWGWWFETASRSLWRHCNVIRMILQSQSWDHFIIRYLFTRICRVSKWYYVEFVNHGAFTNLDGYISGSVMWTHIPQTQMSYLNWGRLPRCHNSTRWCRTLCQQSIGRRGCQSMNCVNLSNDLFRCNMRAYSPLNMQTGKRNATLVKDCKYDLHFVSCGQRDFLDRGMI